MSCSRLASLIAVVHGQDEFLGRHLAFSTPSAVDKDAFTKACRTGNGLTNTPSSKCGATATTKDAITDARLEETWTSLKANLANAGIEYMPEYAMIIANSIQETGCFAATEEYCAYKTDPGCADGVVEANWKKYDWAGNLESKAYDNIDKDLSSTDKKCPTDCTCVDASCNVGESGGTNNQGKLSNGTQVKCSDYCAVHYHGRGFLQLTWSSNYIAAKFGKDIDSTKYSTHDTAEEATNRKAGAWKSAAWYWKNVVRDNGVGGDTRKYIHTDDVNLARMGASVYLINGALECENYMADDGDKDESKEPGKSTNTEEMMHHAHARMGSYKELYQSFTTVTPNEDSSCYGRGPCEVCEQGTDNECYDFSKDVDHESALRAENACVSASYQGCNKISGAKWCGTVDPCVDICTEWTTNNKAGVCYVESWHGAGEEAGYCLSNSWDTQDSCKTNSGQWCVAKEDPNAEAKEPCEICTGDSACYHNDHQEWGNHCSQSTKSTCEDAQNTWCGIDYCKVDGCETCYFEAWQWCSPWVTDKTACAGRSEDTTWCGAE